MAAPIPLAAAPVLPTFDWHLDGNPDLTDPAVVAALPADLKVRLSEVKHRFVAATPCLDWEEVPGATAADPPVAVSLPQETLDLLCVVGGLATQWIRSKTCCLLLSHRPDHAQGMFAAWVGPGGLDLSATHHELGSLLRAITEAKLACGADNRLQLGNGAFFEDEKRPASGAGSAASRNWMYSFTGGMLVGSEDGDTESLGKLQRAVQPRRLSVGRDLPASNYCRVLSSLHKMASDKDPLVQQALIDPLVPSDEVAEYVADLWRRLVSTGYPFSMKGKMAHRNLELVKANSLLSGTDSDKEAAFRQMFPMLSSGKRLVLKCIRSGCALSMDQGLIGNFEQLAGEVLPGIRWSTASCLDSVEHELGRMGLETLIDSWGESPLEILSNLRSHLKQERAATAATLKAIGTDEESDRGLASASGLEARKSPAFLETKRQLVGCSNFLSRLDILLASQSKPWYLKAVRQMNLSSQNVPEMEACSGDLKEWPRYWPMAISRGADGKVHDEVQGKKFPDDQVDHLLKGDWHKIDWILLFQLQEQWTDDAEPDGQASLRNFDSLTSVTKVLHATMKMLRLARDSDSESDPCTCKGFMAKIIRLERRSRALPKGSPAREQALDNMVETLSEGLLEFGARWSKQWAKPTNYSKPLVLSFADKQCFVMRTFDKQDKVADTLHDIREVLPVIFEGGSFAPGGAPDRKEYTGRSPPRHQKEAWPLQLVGEKKAPGGGSPRVRFEGRISDSEEEEEAPLAPLRKRKKKGPTLAQIEAKKARHAVGIHAHLVKRHKKDGSVSTNKKNNTFISAGSVTNIFRKALKDEYPKGLCESSLLSHREGDQRFMLCDCEGKQSHDFPAVTGPRDRARWARIAAKSKEALKT